MFSLEVFMAFRSTEPKGLAVVPDKLYPMPRVDGAGAEVALLDPHRSTMKYYSKMTHKVYKYFNP